MEELLIEEKAKRYDGNYKAYIELINRLEDVKEAIKKQNYGIAMDVLCKSYPEFQVTTHSELKESEDERIRKELLQIVKENEDSFYMVMTPNKREKLIAWLEKGAKGNEREIPIPEPPLTIKHAKEVMGIKQDDAWSEEDELMLMSIIQTLKLTNGAAQMKIDWLKDLKPQSHWKPSDEQMKALEGIKDYVALTSGYWGQTMTEIIKQLKQL